MTKEQILKLIESRIDTMTALVTESIELIYNAGYNESVEDCVKEIEARKEISVFEKEIWNAAIEAAALSIQYESDGMLHDEIIRKLKK